MTSNPHGPGNQTGNGKTQHVAGKKSVGGMPASESWQHKLNKALIAIGVIAFGLIVTDRVLEAFRADDVPAGIADSDSADTGSASVDALNPRDGSQTAVATETAVQGVAGDDAAGAEATAIASTPGDVTQADVLAGTDLQAMPAERVDREDLVKLETLFGSRLIFVSVAEPAYVLTEDERRFEVGSTVDEATTLAGITDTGLILDQSGDLLLMSLPDPTGP